MKLLLSGPELSCVQVYIYLPVVNVNGVGLQRKYAREIDGLPGPNVECAAMEWALDYEIVIDVPLGKARFAVRAGIVGSKKLVLYAIYRHWRLPRRIDPTDLIVFQLIGVADEKARLVYRISHFFLLFFLGQASP